MTTPRPWKATLLLPWHLWGTLAIGTCLRVGGVQATNTGARLHARGEYEASTATYVIGADDDLDAIGERFQLPIADLMQENRLETTVIEPGQRLKVGGYAPAEAGARAGVPAAPAKYSPDAPA